MPVTDPIADMLTIVRNGSRAKKDKVDIKSSKINLKILDIFKREGYIKNFKPIDDKRQGLIRVYLKYDDQKQPMIHRVKRVSKPSRRVYAGCEELPKVQGGLGVAVISTSKGVMSDRQARKLGVGGEVLCQVW